MKFFAFPSDFFMAGFDCTREAARPAVNDWAQLSREYVAKVALSEVVQSDTDSLDKTTSVESNRSESAPKHNVGRAV